MKNKIKLTKVQVQLLRKLKLLRLRKLKKDKKVKKKTLTKKIVEQELKRKIYPVIDRYIERESREIINELRVGIVNETSTNKSNRKTR